MENYIIAAMGAILMFVVVAQVLEAATPPPAAIEIGQITWT